MTVGKPTALILKFSLPLIVTNLGQQFYMIADASIVGRGIGVKALASVGAADWIYWLILWGILGLTQGFSVFISRYFGEKKYYEMNKTIAMSSILSGVVSIVLTVLGLILAKPLITLMKTPADIKAGAVIYLTTMISGTIVVAAYNMASSVLRAFGDGKSPLIAMGIAALLNIGLDLLFVFVFKWGIFGAAFASVLSQIVSFLYCLKQIKKIECVNLPPEIWKHDFVMMKKLLLFGMPVSLQFMLIALGGIVIQSTINLQGSVFVAGYTALNKLYGLLESTAISLGTAFTTYFAQNFGAGKKERVKSGMKTGVMLCIVSSVIVAVVMLVFGKYLLQSFLDVNREGGVQALDVAWRYLSIMTAFMPVLYLIYIYKNVLQAAGISVWSMVSGVTEFIVRVIMGKVIILWLGSGTLFYIEPVAWLGALLPVMIPYFFYRKKLLFGE